MDDTAGRERITGIAGQVRDEFARNRRVMSFDDYLTLFLREPARQARSAAQYLRDVFDHFGSERVRHPTGTVQRFKLFDAPFSDPARRLRLIGQEEAQNRVYRILAGFVREGKANKLILLHGPNGSAKSTFVECLVRALEHYATLDEGALYRFNWIFPSEKHARPGIGFSGGRPGPGRAESYATLPGEVVDARVRCELSDHPLFLIPRPRRVELLGQALEAAGAAASFVVSEYIRDGDLCHKCRPIYEALLTTYQGDYLRVLRHVQVERLYLSRRYQQGVVTVEPQLSVDARLRQVTADRGMASLPPALQSLALYEVSGELVSANRGLLDYADLLKRPVEAYKYLLTAVEQGRVGLESANLHLDVVFVGTSNEGHLAMFKEIPEFTSFKGRIELVRVPYLLDWEAEARIYTEQIRPDAVGKHVAPHAFAAAALWSVLTRMRKPLVEKYPKALAETIGKLAPLDKAELYAHGAVPEGVSGEAAAELRALIPRIHGESETYPNYEGRTGASPREIKTVLLNAAQNAEYPCLSPAAVLEELEDLCKNVTVYEFLKQEPLPGGYHENRKFIHVVRERVLDWVDDEVRAGMDLVEESQYLTLLARYVTQVSHWLKSEKVRNPVTGAYEDPDEDLMGEVERTLGVGPKKNEFRSEIIAAVGAWVVDHPNRKPDYAAILPRHIERLREAYWEQQKKTVKRTLEDLLAAGGEGAARMDKEARARVETTLANLRARHGYCDRCSREAVTALLRKRYA